MAATPRARAHSAFGVRFRADFSLPRLPVAGEAASDLTELVAATAGELERRWSSSADPPVWETVFPDLGPMSLELGRAGDHLLRLDGRPAFHFAPAATRVLCVASTDPAWLRFLLDTVLWLVSLIRGFQALHAAAIVLGGDAVAIVGAQGGGKTSLVAELVARGHELLTDDVLALERDPDGRAIAHPGPPLMNLPLKGPGAQPDGALGERLAVLGTDDPEAWTLLDGQAAPALLGAVILLRRGGEGPVQLGSADASIFDLLAGSICRPHLPAAERARFLMLADVLETVPVLALHAGVEQSPGALAGAVERLGVEAR